MASSSGTSSGLRNSSSEEDVQQMMDRKRKRMISNRESARRSRQRKQKHLDDLVAQLSQIKRENNEIQTRMNVTTHLYFNIEAENSILRAQVVELSHRLASLNDIIDNANANLSNSLMEAAADQDSATAQSDHSSNNDDYQIGDDFFMNPWSSLQPIMDMVMY